MIINKSVKMTIKDKNGKVLKNVERQNMILDNFLLYMNFKVLPQRFNLYPEYMGIGWEDAPMKFCYLTTTDQNITKQSTSMNFNLKTDYNAAPVNSLSTFSSTGNSFTYNIQYDFTIPSGLDGQTLRGLGFGADNNAVSDYLFAFIDISSIDLTLLEGFILEVRREDRLTTVGEYIAGVFDQGTLHLGINNYDFGVGNITFAELERICLCDEGGSVVFNATTDELTLTRDDNVVEITGFPTIQLSDHELLYPSDDLYSTWEVIDTIDNLPEQPIVDERQGYRYRTTTNIVYDPSLYFNIGDELLFKLDGVDYFAKVDYFDEFDQVYLNTGGNTLPTGVTMENIRVIQYNLFPTPPNKIKFIEYTYAVQDYDFMFQEFNIVDRYKIKNKLIDVDFTFNGETFTIKHFYERGDA